MASSSSVEPMSMGRRFTADFLASLVVFMVALPLCIGIAQACGLPPEAGIVTGIVGGLLVGTLAGSPLQVSGPAAGLIVLVLEFMDNATVATGNRAGAVALLGLAIVLAGAIQMIAGFLRLGQWFRAVSPSVVEGMLAGIGVTIIAKQFHEMVDDSAPKSIVESLLTIPNAIWKAFDPPVGASANHTEAALIGLVSIIILVTWKLLKPKTLKFIPSAVVAVIAAIVLNEFGRPLLEAFGMQLGPAVDNHGGIGVERVRVSSDLLGPLTVLHWPGWEILSLGLLWKAALTFAFIASAETLLCATAVDSLHKGPRTKYDRELVAQGIGNMVAGSLGGLPMTGVIVRSKANVDAGAQSRVSAILHGAWLLLFVVLLPGVVSRIPAAALAAILVYTGWNLLNLAGTRRLWRESHSEALILMATAAGVVFGDLLTGVILGIVLSALKLLLIFSRLKVTREDEPSSSRTHIILEGAATFIRLPNLAESLDGVPQGRKVHIHLDGVQLVDHAIFQLLMNYQKQYESTGGEVYIDWGRLHAHFHNGAEQAPPRPNPSHELRRHESEFAGKL